VKSAKRGRSIDTSGYDAGKKIKGKKRHILVDTLGLLLHAVVHPADIQERDGGVLVLSTLFGLYPFLQKLFADGGYQGPVFQKASAKILPHLHIEIVKHSDQAKGLELLPRRWVVERTFVGLIAAAGWPRISKILPTTRSLISTSPRFLSCSESFV
jgi:transposase